MSSIYLKVTIEKNWRSQDTDFSMPFVKWKYNFLQKQSGIENRKFHTHF